MKLPTKPPPYVDNYGALYGYTADQLHDYGEACARAALEEAARLMEPKLERPCDCVVCDCGNAGDKAFVMAWDADKERANATRAIEVKQ